MSQNLLFAGFAAVFAAAMSYALWRALRSGKALYWVRPVDRTASPGDFWASIWPLIIAAPIFALIAISHFLRWLSE